MSNNVSFFSTVCDLRRPNIYNLAESYLNVAGRIGIVADIGATVHSALLREVDRKIIPWHATALKITSMVLSLGILPLIALLIKIKGRYFQTQRPYVYQWASKYPKVVRPEAYQTALFLGLNKAYLTTCESILQIKHDGTNSVVFSSLLENTSKGLRESVMLIRQRLAEFPQFKVFYPLGFA